jgi:hypothetical protein
MKRFLMIAALVLTTIVHATTQATTSTVAVDPIIGRWDGTGYLSDFHMQFKQDHTFTIVDDWASNKADNEGRKWAKTGNQYQLTESSVNMRSATIDADGQLIVEFKNGHGPKITLRRQGAKAPVPANAGPAPQGEWRFAYTNKSNTPANSPALFDVMNFISKDKLKLKSTCAGQDFERAYQVAGNVISVDTASPMMPKLDFAYRWDDNGKILRLTMANMENSPSQFEWTFLRPDQFLPLEIDGTWTGTSTVTSSIRLEYRFQPDGRLVYSAFSKSDGKAIRRGNPRFSDYYRLWRAPCGKVVTVINFNAEMSSQQTQMFTYERRQNELTLTPLVLEEDGKLTLHPEGRSVWTLLKPAP